MLAALCYDKTLLPPPGTPDSIIRAYWDATEAMLKSADYHKEADPIVGAASTSVVGEALDRGFKQNFKMDPGPIDWLKGTLRKYAFPLE